MGHILLGLLSDGAKHGYELKRQYDRRFPVARPLAFGQVYTALDRLQKSSLVEPAGTAKAGAAERTTFRITRAGRDELGHWLREIESADSFASSALQIKVTLALLSADEDIAVGFLRAQRSAHLSRMREYTKRTTDPAAPLSEVLAADYALTHLAADLNWIDAAETRIHDLAEELQR